MYMCTCTCRTVGGGGLFLAISTCTTFILLTSLVPRSPQAFCFMQLQALKQVPIFTSKAATKCLRTWLLGLRNAVHCELKYEPVPRPTHTSLAVVYVCLEHQWGWSSLSSRQSWVLMSSTHLCSSTYFTVNCLRLDLQNLVSMVINARMF